MLNGARVPIVIVGYGNPGDIADCLAALAVANSGPSFAALICENGGPAAYEALVTRLSACGGPCAGIPEALDLKTDALTRVARLRLGQDGPVVLVAEARENLGYAGGINAWLAPLGDIAGWEGVWVLNPDTQPEPDALAELVDYARRHDKGMVGSRVMYMGNPQIVRSRGLRWRTMAAATLGVDMNAPVLPAPDPDDVDRRIDAPSGASFYVTRPCLERIGLMDERYFLFYEDLDWGLRAKSQGGVGYAYRSVVPHIGGSSIGSVRSPLERSELAVYLNFRNRLIFVRRHYGGWYIWTAAMALVRALEFLAAGAVGNFLVAMRGTYAGLRGETGRPDHIMARRIQPSAAP